MIKRSRKGQGLAEYAIVISLVALVCIVILGLVGLAVSRNYGLIAGVLGAKKEIGSDTTVNHIFFDTNPPRCGVSGHVLGFYAQFFSDIPNMDTRTDITVATDNGLVPTISLNGSPGPGIGNYIIQLNIPVGASCPNSLVIQTPKDLGGQTLAYTVLHEDWDH